MSWKKLLQSNSVHRHTASRQELSDIRRLVARDLADAAIPALSEDRRFATAYNAALQTAKMAIACAGYRIASVPGHHRLTFEGAKLSLGKQAEQLADYFDACRRKRKTLLIPAIRNEAAVGLLVVERIGALLDVVRDADLEKAG